MTLQQTGSGGDRAISPRPDGVQIARYGRLSYTNFDGGAANGWQVKQRLHLAADEEHDLLAGIDAQLDAGVELPRFPTTEMLTSFPRRLVVAGATESGPTFEQRAGASVTWWHHAPAGADGAGRPGNVFIDVQVDRHPAASVVNGRDAVRPIDWWRSEDWATPYGARAVTECEILPMVRPGDHVGAAAVIDFLLDDQVYRLGVLALLLDACAAAVAGGPAVVLGTQTTDSAALWIGAVTHLTSAAMARRLSFSTLERSSSLESRLRQGVLLCCVPLQDVDTLTTPERGYTVIREDEQASTGDLDGAPHLTAAGDRIAVTEWSILAGVVLFDRAHARYALESLDRQTATTATQVGWPLALVAAEQPEGYNFADGSWEASRLLVQYTPADVAPADLVTAQRLVAHHISDEAASARSAWELLSAATRTGDALSPLAVTVLQTYAVRALRDQDWLVQSGGPPLPSGRWDTDDTWDEVSAEIRVAVDRLWSMPPDSVTRRTSVGVMRLAVGLGLVGPEIVEHLRDQAVQQLAAPLRESPESVIDDLGPVPEDLLALIIRPALSAQLAEVRRPFGDRLPRTALDWLFPDHPTPLVPNLSDGQVDLDLCCELAYLRAMSNPTRYAEDRQLAVTAALEAGMEPEVLRPMLASPPLTLSDLHGIEQHGSFRWNVRRLPLEYFGTVLTAEPPSWKLSDLCSSLAERRSSDVDPPYGVTDLARMRALAAGPWSASRTTLRADVGAILRGGLATRNFPQVTPHAEVLVAVQAAAALATAMDVSTHDVERLVRSRMLRGGEADPNTVQHVLTGMAGLRPADVAVAALLGDPKFPEPQLSEPVTRWMHVLVVETGHRRWPILRHCLAVQAERSRLSAEPLLEAITRVIWQLLAGHDHRERAAKSCERFAAAWVKATFPADAAGSRRRGSS